MHKKRLQRKWFILAIAMLMLQGQHPRFVPYAALNANCQCNKHLRVPPHTMRTRQTIGMAYGPFREDQSPEWGIYPTLSEVRQDMALLRLVANDIHTYGCRNLETVVTATHEAGLPLTLGVWLSGNSEEDTAEIACAVSQAQANSHITSVVVGNESVLFGRLTVSEVCSYTQQVREDTGLLVTSAEPWHIWVSNSRFDFRLDTCASLAFGKHLVYTWD